MLKIEILEEKKILHVITAGFMKSEEAHEVLEKLKQTFQSIDTSKYYFILDTSDFKVVFQSELDVLGEVLELYAKTSFIKKFFIMPQSILALLQAQKLKIPDLSSDIVRVHSFDEALSMIE